MHRWDAVWVGFSNLFPKSKTPALAVTMLGVLCVFAGAIGSLNYNSAHFEIAGLWRIVLTALGLVLVILGGSLLVFSTDGTEKGSVNVDLTGFPGLAKKSLNCSSQTTVDAFLDKIFMQVLRGGGVAPQSYGSDWILTDATSGRQFRNIGAAWARGRGHKTDDRPLPEAGIYPGMKLHITRAEGGLTVDASPYLGGDRTPTIYSWSGLSTAGNLLNLICYDLLPEEDPQSYGKSWVLFDQTDGRKFTGVRPADPRSLRDVGIQQSSRLIVRRLQITQNSAPPEVTNSEVELKQTAEKAVSRFLEAPTEDDYVKVAPGLAVGYYFNFLNIVSRQLGWGAPLH
jgi:hypothetical protein